MPHIIKRKFNPDENKNTKEIFWTHTYKLIWKCYSQRQRRWHLLVMEAVFSAIMFLAAILTTKPVFLARTNTEPTKPLHFADILATYHKDNIMGYVPNTEPFNSIMKRAGELLNTSMVSAATENELNQHVYHLPAGSQRSTKRITWVIWKPQYKQKWSYIIQSTERASYVTGDTEETNTHLAAGFMAVQLAIDHAIVEHANKSPLELKLKLVTMPVSPLMSETRVRQALSKILIFYTISLLPPVLETQSLVVTETRNNFKRAMCLRNVGYSSIYLSWIAYGYFTALPNCMLGALTLIIIFRWIHLFVALVTVLMYFTVMMMVALMMAMFHDKPSIACIWSTLFTILMTYLSELMVHHHWDQYHGVVTWALHLILPPLGLIGAFNDFALLQSGYKKVTGMSSLLYILISWSVVVLVYYAILMLLQRTIGRHRAIGGQIHWKTIIFKAPEDVHALHTIEPPTLLYQSRIQEVDELVAKAVTFRDVTKTIMGEPMLKDASFEIYRGELTMIFVERTQLQTRYALEDLMTGLTFAEKGKINVLGNLMKPGTDIMCSLYMMGYCHFHDTLIDDLTVEEHLILFIAICLWRYSSSETFQYRQVRIMYLLKECDLMSVRDERIRDLDMYYKAQLCWALAVLLEPKIIVIPEHHTVEAVYNAVIRDKIMKYRGYLTIIKLTSFSLELEYADRIFMFDSKVLVFGGTPAYMFFKFGRDYRLRIIVSLGGAPTRIKTLLERAEEANAIVRAHLGKLLILKIPVSPTENVAALVKDLTEHSEKYGVRSFVLSVPDIEEVCSRAILETKVTQAQLHEDAFDYFGGANENENILKPQTWERRTKWTNLHFRFIAKKFMHYHKHHSFYLFITFTGAILSGLVIGMSLGQVLQIIDNPTFHKGELLTIEAAQGQKDTKTTLLIRIDDSPFAKSIANAYILTDDKTPKDVKSKLQYTALYGRESTLEYLMTRALDSPQAFVYEYLYGAIFSLKNETTMKINVLYGMSHHDAAAAPRSLAHTYTALLRHITGELNAHIHTFDEPLFLDISPWVKGTQQPPLIVQIMLILTVSHITLLPSEEPGLIRHVQKHATNFSPFRYWLTLYFCDILFYWLLVFILSIVMLIMLCFYLPSVPIEYLDLVYLPVIFAVYGVGCIPQAYIFSLGPRPALNTMSYMMFNLIFGETTIIAKFFYGDSMSFAMAIMALSPQFNVAYAFVKIKQIFLYNNECFIIKAKNICLDNSLHKCCDKCGMLQECFVRKSFLNFNPGILFEFIAMFVCAGIILIILLIIEYKVCKRLWLKITLKMALRDLPAREHLNLGVLREEEDVLDKKNGILENRKNRVSTFGERLLVYNLTKTAGGLYKFRNVNFGMGKGEVLAIAGLKQHGRLKLLETLAGYKMPNKGSCWSESKWNLIIHPHLYSQQIAMSCDADLFPPWLTVNDALELIAELRGVPYREALKELDNLYNALDLDEYKHTLISDLLPLIRTRVHFMSSVIGAPPVILIDECTAYQRYSMRRIMYGIIDELKKRGHAIYISSSGIETPLPVASRIGMLVDGTIFDIDTLDNLVERHSINGYTVVVHLKDEVNVQSMFEKYFKNFVINDTSEVLVNVQVHDNLTFSDVFEKMEQLKQENSTVYSYIVTITSVNYIYNSILSKSKGNKRAKGLISWERLFKKIISFKSKIVPSSETMNNLEPFQHRYDISKLNVLPWSVIFHRE